MLRVLIASIAGILVISAGAWAAPMEGAADTDDQQMTRVVESNNLFALQLYQRLSQNRRDICFSPCSIYEALAMLEGGAQGMTAGQIARALQMDQPAGMHEGLSQAVQGLQADARRQGYRVDVRNAVFGQSNAEIGDEYLQLLETYYGASLKRLDFLTNASSAKRQMARWLKDNGAGRLEEIFRPGLIDEYTQFVIINTVRLQVDPAPMAETQTPDADQSDEESQESPQPLSLVLFLTMEPDEPAEQDAGDPSWREVSQQVPLARGLLSQLDLQAVLEEMKLTEAFSKAADFTSIASDSGLHISRVLHGAWLQEKGNGTEAVAATIIVVSLHENVGPVLTFLP
ncbi:MAG: serpin family protein [Phycisphaerae bacterium]